MRVGDKVTWHPPEARLLTFMGLTPEHPGTATYVGPKHVQVEWVSRDGTYVSDGVYAPEFLRVVNEVEYERRREEVLNSDWPGFSET